MLGLWVSRKCGNKRSPLTSVVNQFISISLFNNLCCPLRCLQPLATAVASRTLTASTWRALLHAKHPSLTATVQLCFRKGLFLAAASHAGLYLFNRVQIRAFGPPWQDVDVICMILQPSLDLPTPMYGRIILETTVYIRIGYTVLLTALLHIHYTHNW